MLNLTTSHTAVLLPIKVVPGASRTAYLGEWDGRAKISVAAPPEKGRANKAVVAYLARLLGTRKHDITIVAGHGSALKTVRIDRSTVDSIRTALRAD